MSLTQIGHMNMRHSRASRIALLALAAVLGGSAVAIATDDNDTQPGLRAGVEVKTIPGSLSDAQIAAVERRAGVPVREAPVARIPSELMQSFSAFRSGTMTAPETRTVPDVTRGGVNRALARTIPTKAGDVTLVPGRTLVCLEVQDGTAGAAGGCSSTAEAERGALIETVKPEIDGPAVVFGLAPDGIERVRLDGPDGARTVNVTDNVWAAEGVRARVATLIGPDETTTAVAVP